MPLEYLGKLLVWDDYQQEEIPAELGSLFPISNNCPQPFHRILIDWLCDKAKSGPYFISTQQVQKRLVEQGWQEYQQGLTALSPYQKEYK